MERSNTPRLFWLAGLALAALAFFGWHLWLTRPMPDLAALAGADLQKRQFAPLSGPLRRIIDQAERVPSQSHFLLGKPAPKFELLDHQDQKRRLDEFLARGPVMVVFYYGYYCDHCVSQLFALNADLAYFNELGVPVVALSADPTAKTRQQFARYGPFGFTILSDPDNRTAEAYGLFRPASPGQPEALYHGTFLIGRDGVVDWVHYASEPFTEHRALLERLARLERRD